MKPKDGAECFVFGRLRVQIPARRPAIPIRTFVDFLNPSRQMMGYLKIRKDSFHILPNPSLAVILSFDAE
jgi:hypothetical protein